MKMQLLGYFVVSLLLVGCGGDSGDSADSQSAALYCEHDGDVWICNEQGSCVRDESVEEFLVEEETDAGTFARLAIKLDNVNITIIAECGSNVSFSNEEEVNTVEVVTEVTGNLGLNE